MIKIIWLIATVYFMSRLVRRVVSSMQEINTERNAPNWEKLAMIGDLKIICGGE